MKRDALVLELRVLNGRHAGACAAARDGLLVGAEDEADVILTDLDPGARLARLHLLNGDRWLIAPADAEPDHESRGRAPPIGTPSHWAGVALCVCAPHTDWPSLPVPRAGAAPEVTSANDAQSSEPDTVAAGETTGGEVLPAQALPEQELGQLPEVGERALVRADAWRWILPVLLLVLFALGYGLWARFDHGAARSDAETASADLTEQAKRQIPDLNLSIAQVGPELRMELLPRPDGRVQVRGWVETVAQFDRLADALGTRRPAPLLRVFVAEDVRTELLAQLAGSYPHLDFVPGAPGVLRVRGIVQADPELEEVLSAVRALLPVGLTLVSDLRLAEKFVPDVKAALATAGFPDAHVHWDGSQIVAVVPMSASGRGVLENTLIALSERFPGLPLSIKPEFLAQTEHEGRGKAPFPIRGVVGGPVPYVILPDGGKLFPGGMYAGWRLQAIEPQLIIFDAPRRLVVGR